MKKILLTLVSLVALSACGSMPNTEYEYTVDYTIGGSAHTYKNVVTLPGDYVPAYIMTNNGREHSIIVRGISGGVAYIFADIVYSGGIPCTVEKFNYEAVRTYRTSRWNGKELKE